jgi:hypothetical protein
MAPSIDKSELTPENVHELVAEAQKQLTRYKKAGKEQKKKMGSEGEPTASAWVTLLIDILLSLTILVYLMLPEGYKQRLEDFLECATAMQDRRE